MTDENCERCGGIGWLRRSGLHWSDPRFGKLIPCPDCNKGMVDNEPKMKEPKKPEQLDLRWMNHTD